MKRSGVIASLAFAAYAFTVVVADAQPRRNAAQLQLDAFVTAVTHYCMANVGDGVDLPQVTPVEGYTLNALTEAEAAAARMPATSKGFRLTHTRGHVVIESATGKACQAKADGPPAQATFDAIGAFVSDPARGFALGLDMSNPPMTFMRIFKKEVGEDNLVVMLNGIQPRGAASMLNVTVSRMKREAPTSTATPAN